MNKLYVKNSIVVGLLLFGIASFLSSCGTSHKAVYFSDLDSTKIREISTSEFKEPLIQTDDILNINIQTIDVAGSAALNQAPVFSGSSASSATGISGFLVDKGGNVELPLLGIMNISGLTTTQAKELIRMKAAKYYKDPTVQVRFANYKITVLGEVVKPSTYTVPNEKVTVLDAISMAGDLTIFGKRENVLLIRDNGNKKDMIRLDLTSSSLVSSPYFYLKQNDVLYIEPTNAKIAANNAPRNQMITMTLSIIALMVTIISRF